MAVPNPAIVGRNGRIWRDYCRGATQEKLAERYALTQQRISQIINEVADGIAEQERADLIKQETDLLRELREQVLREVWDAKPIPVTVGKDGDILTDPETGEVVRDHSGRLAGLAAFERLTKQLHRVTGVDAPVKVDLGFVGEDGAAKKAAADALAHLHGGTDDSVES